VYFGQASTTAQLLLAGADVNAPSREGETPLMLAVRGNHPELVKTLIEKGADVDAAATVSGSTALILAVDRGLVGTTELLLKAGSNASYRDKQGRDAISAAESIGNPELTTLLRRATP
jgi:ankyrin repeat protein